MGRIKKKAKVKDAGFNINKAVKLVDPATRKWIRNSADERAVTEGCIFSERRAEFTLNWISKNCIIYEGELAGTNMHLGDWQVEVLSQIFGWVIKSDIYDRYVRRFRQASVWIPKKNGKSPTLAACGIYLLCGDGERGQKCYSVARDGKQAEIAHDHAIQFVRQNSILDAHCHINNQTKQITYFPTSSKYMIVTGENKKGTEGYNGSLLTDEVHVVDDDLMKRLKGAGISRSEPLNCEFSTAGDDMESYAYRRYEFGKSIAEGRAYLQNFYFKAYEAPQDTRLDLIKDDSEILAMGKAANPTMGRIVREAEFMDAWQEAKRSHTTAADFGQYRLSIWGLKAGAWIDRRDWKRTCRADIPWKKLIKRKLPACVGLDLSKTRDSSAITVMPIDEENHKRYAKTYTYIPEASALKIAQHVNIFDWKEHIVFTKLNVIPYSVYISRLRQLRKDWDLRLVAYDPYRCNTLIKMLVEEEHWPEDMFMPISQTWKFVSPAAQELERMIISYDETFIPEDNPVLDWQFGHCQLQYDKHGNYMPEKPEKDSYQKIDGIASMNTCIAGIQCDEYLTRISGFTSTADRWEVSDTDDPEYESFFAEDYDEQEDI